MAFPHPRIDAETYLARERAGENKHEFFAGEIFAMACGSPAYTIARL